MKNSIWSDIVLSSLLVCLMGGNALAANSDVHQQAIVIDTHSDTTPYFEREDWDFSQRHESQTDMDLPRIRE